MNNKEFILKALIESKKLIFFEENWCKKNLAMSKSFSCLQWETFATAWSSFGAIQKILHDNNANEKLIEILRELQLHTQDDILYFDLKHSHMQVLDLFSEVIGKIADELNLHVYSPVFSYKIDDLLYFD